MHRNLHGLVIPVVLIIWINIAHYGPWGLEILFPNERQELDNYNKLLVIWEVPISARVRRKGGNAPLEFLKCRKHENGYFSLFLKDAGAE